MLLALSFVSLAGFLSAVMDTLHHHWSNSVFSVLARRYTYSYFGPADKVWLRRYNTPGVQSSGLKPVFKGVFASAVEAVYDAWHLAKSAQVLAFCVAIAVSPPSLWMIPAAYLTFVSGFLFWYSALDHPWVVKVVKKVYS